MFQQPRLFIVRNRSMNFTITKMEHFVVIVNGFEAFTVAAKSPMLTVAAFLDPALHSNKCLPCSIAKAVSWLRPKRIVIHACLLGKYLNKLEKLMT